MSSLHTKNHNPDSVSRRALLTALAVSPLALKLPAFAAAPAIDSAAIDALAERFRTELEIPGLAVAITTPQQDYAKGYGIRTLGEAGAVDEHTLFAIASNSKAFTAAALAVLVDEGKVGWDQPVRTYLPEFKMFDPAVSQMMTVRDLLTHRSGLPLGAGDLLYFPPSTHKSADVLKALEYLKPVRGFRSGYDYDNILYVVAGLVIERVSGKSWQDFVTQRLLRPLGMLESVPDRDSVNTANVAGRHGRRGPPVTGLGPLTKVFIDDPTSTTAAAGGINTSASDIVHWLRAQLDHGKLPDGSRVWSEKQAAELWTPQTIMSSSDGAIPDDPTNPVTSTYALGWIVRDYRGERILRHSGGLHGQVTQTALLPKRGIGVAVLTNVEGYEAGGLINAVIDQLIGAPAFDWLESTKTRTARRQQEALKTIGAEPDQPPPGGLSLPLARYAGRYRDAWYGDVVIKPEGDGLAIQFVPTPAFHCRLEQWGGDSFRTHFSKDAGEDAVLHFAVEKGKVTGLTMKALSPIADFSYDFHHLSFKPVAGK